MRNSFNWVFFKWRCLLKWSRGNYQEKACLHLSFLKNLEKEKVFNLKNKYHANYEFFLNEVSSRDAYHYLYLLDQGFKEMNLSLPPPSVLMDVGSKNFYYACSLKDFFKPGLLRGVELDAYRIYNNFFSRFDYAQYYISFLENTTYHAADILKFNLKANLITLFYPFVSSSPLINWGLPLSHLKPQQLFARCFHLLEEGGHLVMLNQGEEEWEEAKNLSQSAQFQCLGKCAILNGISETYDTAILSVWGKK